MGVPIAMERIEHKANVYKVLSVLFQQPTIDFGYYLEHFYQSVAYLYPDLLERVEKLQEEFDVFKTDLLVLRAEHARLFIGPFDLIAPPYSSIYIGTGREVYGESTFQAKQMYQQAGLSMLKGNKEVPDHISIELEFLYYLYFSYYEKGEEHLFDIAARFLNDHLLRWADPFVLRVKEGAELRFYPILAELLLEVLCMEQLELQTPAG